MCPGLYEYLVCFICVLLPTIAPLILSCWLLQACAHRIGLASFGGACRWLVAPGLCPLLLTGDMVLHREALHTFRRPACPVTGLGITCKLGDGPGTLTTVPA